MESQTAGDTDRNTEWEGYSHYKTVSNSIVESIEAAISAYAELEARHAEDAKVKPDFAAWARANIKSAALQLLPELERNKGEKDAYEDILGRWTGRPNDDEAVSDGGLPAATDDLVGGGVERAANRDNDPDGFLDDLDDVSLQDECPKWLEQFVLDIKTAGFELGYLQAGRTVKSDDGGSIEEDVNAMFDGLDLG